MLLVRLWSQRNNSYDMTSSDEQPLYAALVFIDSNIVLCQALLFTSTEAKRILLFYVHFLIRTT